MGVLHDRDDRRLAADQAAAAGEGRRRSSGAAQYAEAARWSCSRRYRGWRDYRIWWAGFVLIILAIYGFFLWWRFQHPASRDVGVVNVGAS